MTIKNVYKHICFWLDTSSKLKKTQVWVVYSTAYLRELQSHLISNRNYFKDYELGEVRWYSAWRRYCFFPAHDTLFDASCLIDLNEFISQLMQKRKKEQPTSTKIQTIDGIENDTL